MQQRNRTVKTITQIFLSLCITTSSNYAMETPEEWKEATWRWLSDSFSTLGAAICHPQEMAEFTASSPWVVNDIVQLTKSFIGNGNVLEVGAGRGTVSCGIAKIRALKLLNAVELNPSLHKTLALRLSEINKKNDEIRLYADCAAFEAWTPSDVENPHGFYDVVVSTLPLTRMPPDISEAIIKKIHTYLKPHGVFIFVSLVGARFWGSIAATCCCARQKYQERITHFDAYINHYFEPVLKKETPDAQVVFAKSTELRNITPMEIYVVAKKSILSTMP